MREHARREDILAAIADRGWIVTTIEKTPVVQDGAKHRTNLRGGWFVEIDGIAEPFTSYTAQDMVEQIAFYRPREGDHVDLELGVD